MNKRYPWGNEPPDGTQCNFKDRDVDTDVLYDTAVNDGYRYTAPVGSYPPNGYGLYDMAGNVFEWCADDRIDYSKSPKHNPTGPTDGPGAYGTRRRLSGTDVSCALLSPRPFSGAHRREQYRLSVRRVGRLKDIYASR